MVKLQNSARHTKMCHKKRSNKQEIVYTGIAFIALVAAVLTLYIGFSKKEIPPGIEVDEKGNMVLAPERKAKLSRELEEIDNAVQYALIATINGFYPCYSCTNGQKDIFLRMGEVWKYGITRKGEKKRYPNQKYGAKNLLFIPQFRGSYGECLKREKIMIYHYPFLPESLARDILLIRPPGNKYDG